MSSIFNHQSNIILFRKFDSSSDITRLRGFDAVKGGIAQLAWWVRSYRGIYRGTGINEWIAISNWRLRQPGFIDPVGSDALTLLGVITWTLVACFGERLILDKLSIYRAVEGIPF